MSARGLPDYCDDCDVLMEQGYDIKFCQLHRSAPAMRDALDFLLTNAQLAPDPRMEGTTDCYLVSIADYEAAVVAIAAAREER